MMSLAQDVLPIWILLHCLALQNGSKVIAQSLQSVQRRKEICVSAVGTYRPLLYKKTFLLPCELIAVLPRRPSALDNPYRGEA